MSHEVDDGLCTELIAHFDAGFFNVSEALKINGLENSNSELKQIRAKRQTLPDDAQVLPRWSGR
jgi:hypothetical protein